MKTLAINEPIMSAPRRFDLPSMWLALDFSNVAGTAGEGSRIRYIGRLLEFLEDAGAIHEANGATGIYLKADEGTHVKLADAVDKWIAKDPENTRKKENDDGTIEWTLDRNEQITIRLLQE